MIFGRMTLTVAFPKATVYDVSHIDVDQGEEFTLTLENVHRHIQWFSDNDPVLDINEIIDTHSADIKASAPGKSVIEIQSHGTILKKVFITVREAKANELGVKFGEPQTK